MQKWCQQFYWKSNSFCSFKYQYQAVRITFLAQFLLLQNRWICSVTSGINDIWEMWLCCLKWATNSPVGWNNDESSCFKEMSQTLGSVNFTHLNTLSWYSLKGSIQYPVGFFIAWSNALMSGSSFPTELQWHCVVARLQSQFCLYIWNLIYHLKTFVMIWLYSKFSVFESRRRRLVL